MFWRFGFHNASSIDGLLDKDDVSLEAILDEDDLLQECKSQNTRLIDYFQRVDVLQRLLAYVTGQIEGEERGRFKYPYVATEVLCSEIWSIVETCVNERERLLVPFWETVLDRPPEDMKTQMVMAAHFAKINAVFLNKKPAEMLAFIESQPSVVERLLRHIETPSFVDLLVRIIQLDEQPAGGGVLEWLSSENLMGRLIELLSPAHSCDVHTVVAELIKCIISMATPSPGAGLTEGLQNGPASNRFARELARRDSVTRLVDYILCEFRADDCTTGSDDMQNHVDDCLTARPRDSPSPTVPNAQTAASSVVHSISVIIELIRKNNSDYFEPYLFHTLRNRLIQVQQQLHAHTDEGREVLESAMKEMVDRMGVVHLGTVLEIMCDKLDRLQLFLREPRSLNGPISTTVGSIIPLTFERYRICELFAELLHCSNMSLLNRSPEFNRLYDSEGRLQGGLAALEELARVIAMGSGERGSNEAMDRGNDEVEPAQELPVSNPARDSPSTLDSDEDMSDDDDEPGSSDDEAMEEIAMYDEPIQQDSTSLQDEPLLQPPILVPSSPSSASSSSPAEIAASAQRNNSSSTDSGTSTINQHSRRGSRRLTEMTDVSMSVGERLKRRMLDMNVLSTLLDLFFEFPWNNFLHSAVYDLIHQILTGRVDGGLNRELTVALFRDAHLMHRIVEGQKRNDVECAKPKGVRLGYMGHLTLISEDVIGALDHFPNDLRLAILKYAPEKAWDEYVTGRYSETKKKDSCLLGGGKPVIAVGGTRSGARWRVDEEDSATMSVDMSGPGSNPSGSNQIRGEFRRTGNGHTVRESSADFGSAVSEEPDRSEARPSQFAQYLAQEMHSSDGLGLSDDEDDEDSGWLSHSTFNLREPPVSARHSSLQRRPLSSNGFDDVFQPEIGANGDDPFRGSSADGDNNFGPFSDAATVGSSEHFSFSTSFTEDMEDSSFDSFGDFGDFQVARDGELTPTADSWSFTSGSTASDEGALEDAIQMESNVEMGARSGVDGS